jgi:hypothetical protein
MKKDREKLKAISDDKLIDLDYIKTYLMVNLNVNSVVKLLLWTA